ncbi:MAG TPA: glycosyltransferase family 4 protein [Candidatus Peribacteraceae bacterium]|nr:glycosyltransferase family 4 protein [Candidatus Peribacteraceae bacterium]
MNILFTRFPLESRLGGAEVQTMALMRGLRTRGHSVMFLGSCPTLLQLCREERIPARALKIGPPPVTGWLALSFLWRRRAMSDKLLAYSLELTALGSPKIDAVMMLSLTEKLLLTQPCVNRGIKVLWIEHDRVGRWLRQNPWLPRLRRLSRLATTICVSELSRKIYLDLGWTPEKTQTIPNGVDESRLRNTASLPQQNGKHVGCVARLSEDKGVDLLIEAVGQLPDVQLTIVGSGPDQEELHALIEERFVTNRVTVRATHENLGAFYRSIDVLVLPSREHDPFGLVAAEAMLSGTPVIVTDACGIAGYLRDGEDALIVPANDAGALQQAILKVLNDKELRQSLATRGRQTAQSTFRLDQMADRYESLLLG